MKFFWTLLAIFCLFNVFALAGDWYHEIPWIDIPAHITFGILVGIIVLRFRGYGPWPQGLLAVVLATLLAGLLWELLEFLRDHYVAIPYGFSLAQRGTADTVRDILDTIVGGFVAYSLQLRVRHPSISLRSSKTKN